MLVAILIAAGVGLALIVTAGEKDEPSITRKPASTTSGGETGSTTSGGDGESASVSTTTDGDDTTSTQTTTHGDESTSTTTDD